MNISSLLSQTKTLLIVGQRTYPYHAAGAQSGYVIIDKVTSGNDASVVFRDAGAIKGEVGTAADDDVHLKVATGSAGSETFVDSIILKNLTGYVYVPLQLGVGTVPAAPLHIAASSTGARISAKIENTNTTSSTSSGAQLELKGNASAVDWLFGTDFGENGNNNFFIQDSNNGLRQFIDGSGRTVFGDSSATTTTAGSIEAVGSIKVRGTNYSLSALNFTGLLTTTGSPTTGTYAVGDVVMDSAGSFYRCTSAGTPGSWTGGGNGVTNALTFNIARNYKVSSGGVIAGGSLGTLSDTSNTFTSTDVGKSITVVGAGAAGVDFTTTIATIASSTSVTLTAAASTAVSAATYGYGTDDGPAINAAITAAASLGGTVSLPPGNYTIATSIAPANNVRIEGSGWGSTILFPFGTTPCIDKIASSGSPLTNSYLARFAIDGARQSGAYNVGTKGIFIQYMSQCTIQDVLVRNCVATGIGTDFLTNGTKIDNCIVINNGRLNQGGGAGAGSNGIGIGTGQYSVEDFVVTNCFASGNGRYGIMIESQTGSTSRGMRFIGCYSVSNFGSGFTDAGGSGAQFISCVSAQNNQDGFAVDNGTVGATAQPGGNTMFIGCESIANTRYGFTYNPTATNTTSAAGAGNIKWTGCKSWNNTSLGWYINPLSGHAVSGIYISDCDATGNGASGIQVSNSVNGMSVTSCKLRSNGQSSSTSKTGFNLTAGTITNLLMIGNKIWDDGGTQKQTYALVFASGAAITTGQIVQNDFRGNLTGVLNNLGTTLTSVIMEKNPGGPYALTYAATLNTDCTLGDIFETTLTGAATLANPTNMVDGQTMRWRFTQDGTGGRILSLGTAFNGTFTLSTAASAVDYLQATYNAATTNWDISNSRSSFMDFGTGSPGTITGQKPGDVYLDFNTGNYYQFS